MLKAIALATAALIYVPASAQDFNYTPGWSNTQNFNRLHGRSGTSNQRRNLQPCRFNMLPLPEQRQLQQRAHTRIAQVGKAAAMPWINRQSERAIAQMVKDGRCRSK